MVFKLEEHSIEVHNSRRPLNRLTLTLTLTLTFDLIFIGGRGIVMDYLCAEFDNFSFSRFGFIVRTGSQTDRQTDIITEADQRYTHATTIGVSNYCIALVGVSLTNERSYREDARFVLFDRQTFACWRTQTK